MNVEEYVNTFFETAKRMGYEIETCQRGDFKGEKQIDFGTKKLHAGHLRMLYSVVKEKGPNVTDVDFESIVDGRPCAIPFFLKINKRLFSEE